MDGRKKIDLETMAVQLLARNAALEAMQSQVVLLLANLTDDPAASIRMTMADVLTNLRRQEIAAAGIGKQDEADIVSLARSYAEDIRDRLLAAKKHKGAQTTQ